MSQLIINSYEEFEQYVGQELGISDYLKITQEQINQFADATLDHQWIHVDTEKAKIESPFHSTIAHGYLNLSILPYLWDQIVQVNNVKMMVNYGIEKLKFNPKSRRLCPGFLPTPEVMTTMSEFTASEYSPA